MATDTENGWLTNLDRQAGIRRGILVHGNVLDVCFCKETQDYRSVVEVITRSLKNRGFDHVVLWDRFSGVQNVPKDVRDSMIREATLFTCAKVPGGSDYDVGPDAPGQANAGRSGEARPNPDDFLAVVHHHMLNPQRTRYAFVLDWSQYLEDAESLSRPTNMIALVCTKLGGVPPALYQGNPAVQELIVPAPGRIEREAFVKRTIDKWKLRHPLRPG